MLSGSLERHGTEYVRVRRGGLRACRQFEMPQRIGEAAAFEVDDAELDVQFVRAPPAGALEILEDARIDRADRAIPLRQRRCIRSTAAWTRLLFGSADVVAVIRSRTPATNCSFCAYAGDASNVEAISAAQAILWRVIAPPGRWRWSRSRT